nr:hypothetical protein [Pseudomonas yamanorum]
MLSQLSFQSGALAVIRGLDNRLEVLLIQTAQVQSAAQLGKLMGVYGQGGTFDRLGARDDFAVIRAPGGDDLAICTLTGFFFVGNEIGQGRLQQGNTPVLKALRRATVLVEDKRTAQIAASVNLILAGEIDVVDVQIQVEALLDGVFKRLLGKRLYVPDLAQGVLDLVQGLAITGMAVSQVSLLLMRGVQVPVGQFHLVVGEFFLAPVQGPKKPGWDAVFEKVVMHTPKVNVERAFGGGVNGLF